MSVFVTGDTHADVSRLSHKQFKQGRYLTKQDYVIIAGDFGLVWDVNESSGNEQHWLQWLSDKKFTTLFLDGNHENFDRLEKIDKNNKKYICDNIVGEVRDSIYHLKRGSIYTIDGKKYWVFGGAESTDKNRRREHISWWPQEIPNIKEEKIGIQSLKENNWEVDYMITHTAPQSIIEQVNKRYLPEFSSAEAYSLTKYLEYIKQHAKYKKWFIGHLHLDEEVDEKHILIYKNIIKIGE